MTRGLVALALLLAGCRSSGPPYSPAQALQTFRLHPDYRIELFAAEPLVSSPVAIEFDEYGRVYVVENPGYPLDTSRTGRVKLLSDSNGDGRPDRASVFAGNLMMPTGVMRWKKGILVTDAPDLLYFEDTDNDGRADIRRVVLTGFAFTNPQHTVNNPVYGLDNWIHIAHENPTTAVIFRQFADRGGDIRFPDRPDAPVLKARGRSIRFRPGTFQIEARSGTSQFGHAFDDFGRYFTMNNSNHQRHEVIAARYLNRNPDLPVAAALEDFSDHGAGAEVYPITRNPRFEMLTEAGTMTSACGMTLFHGASFIAEPVHNLVHRDLWSQRGATFTARRADGRAEFLASTDAWFRPVNFYAGPDGALYLVDYYRLSIEHPEWTSTHTHTSPDLYKGQDLGRIWRIVPASGVPLPRAIRQGDAAVDELVSHLSSPHSWWRRNAQRLLVDRPSDAAAQALERLADD
ncbi:MAG: PVC-type heme-binding CxxCH protein, partial [Bryobacteraceae bacterium]